MGTDIRGTRLISENQQTFIPTKITRYTVYLHKRAGGGGFLETMTYHSRYITPTHTHTHAVHPPTHTCTACVIFPYRIRAIVGTGTYAAV